MYKIKSIEELLNEQLTPHFKRCEFACKCGGKYCNPRHINISPLIVGICEILREYIDNPIRISSGCRCKTWNSKQGGVDSSSHLFGFAADCHSSIGGKKLFIAIKELYDKGLIPNLRFCQYYQKKDFIHIDCDCNKIRNTIFKVVD